MMATFRKGNKYQTVCLHGDFFSGKTLDYIEASDKVMDFYEDYRYWVNFNDGYSDLIKKRQKFILNLWYYHKHGGIDIHIVLRNYWIAYNSLLGELQ